MMKTASTAITTGERTTGAVFRCRHCAALCRHGDHEQADRLANAVRSRLLTPGGFWQASTKPVNSGINPMAGHVTMDGNSGI